MAAPPKLRPIGPDEPVPVDRPEETRSALPVSPWWIFVGLAAAGYAALAYMQADQRAQIANLQAEVSALETELEVRERLIDAQSGRLADVRARVESLTDLLDAPLATSPE